MYRTLASEDTEIPIQPAFAIDGIRETHVESFRGYKTSRRTLLICSIILISLAGLCATWVFVAKPHFYPKLHLAHRKRSLSFPANLPEEQDLPQGTHMRRSRNRRSLDFDRFIREDKKESATRTMNLSNPGNSIYQTIKDIESFPYNESRLPDNLIPEQYDIHLNVLDLNSENFTGTVKIKLNCERSTDKIVFHGRRIHLTNVSVLSGRTVVHYDKISYNKRYELFVIEMASKLEEGSLYDLLVDYEVGFGKNLAGLYKSFYTDYGVEKTIVSTHFEPTDARSAFPCLDEPFFKAIFRISITHAKNLTALSNMPIENTEDLDHSFVKDVFQPTVKMSTYLIAFTVNDFKYKEKFTEGPEKIKVRVYARAEDQDRIDYALHAATKIIHFYGKFFNISYPLPKLDLLSVPDFMAGAMEDWGLVSFRSAYIIFDSKLSTVENMRQVALVIAHELAHQWFGNLVTMKWWNDIWLNEGFANFVEMLGTDEVNPQFRSLDLQVPHGWQSAISLDSLNSSHPVSQDVQRVSEIDELFDAISYNKGAALLRMVQGFMGQKLEKGVIEYLQKYRYSNAETNDLWISWSLVSDLNISQIMNTWTKQRSFPIVTINKINSTSYSITQQSFLEAMQSIKNKSATLRETIANVSSIMADHHQNITSSNTTNSTFGVNSTGSELSFGSENRTLNNATWRIPFTYITNKNNTETLKWIHDKKTILHLNDSDIKWIKANVKTNGFYIVNYDNETWKEFEKQLHVNHTVFSPTDRAGIIHDAFKLVCERMSDPQIVLSIIKYLPKERHFIPFTMLRSKCECLSSLIQDKKLKQRYMKYIWSLQSNLIIPAMIRDRSNVSRFTIFERTQRYETMYFALKFNASKELKNETQKLFNSMVKSQDEGISPENRALALMYGFDPNSTEHANFIWDLFKNSPLDSDRKLLMKSIPQFKGHINQTLARAMNTSITRVQDTISLLSALVKNGFRKEVWEYVIQNYNTFCARYGGGYQLGQLFTEVTTGFTTEEMYKKIDAFLEEHPIGAKGSRTNRLILEKIRNNIDRHTNGTANTHIADRVRDWLDKTGDETNSKRTITLIG